MFTNQGCSDRGTTAVALRQAHVVSAGKKALKQTAPPSIPLSKLFPDGIYPHGQWQSYAEKCASATKHNASVWLSVLPRSLRGVGVRCPATKCAACSQRWRETNEEKRAMERSNEDMMNATRKAAEVHRQVRMPRRPSIH